MTADPSVSVMVPQHEHGFAKWEAHGEVFWLTGWAGNVSGRGISCHAFGT